MSKKKHCKHTAIRDKMLQLSKLQLTELNYEELASLMLAIPANHPHFFNVVAEVERRKVEALDKMPDEMKKEFIELMSRVPLGLIDHLANGADYNRADMLIKRLSEKRGRLN